MVLTMGLQNNSGSTIVHKLDNTKTFVKYQGDKPTFLQGKTAYTYVDILAILNNVEGEWYIEYEE